MPRRIPTSTYRLQVHRDFPLTAARDVVPYLARLGVGRRVHVAVFHRRTGQHARLRHLQPQRDQSRARRRGGARRIHRGDRRPRARSYRGLRAQPHGHRHVRESMVARRPRERAERSQRPDSSTSTGRRSNRSCAPSCCCQSSAISMAGCSNTASCTSIFRDGALVLRYFEQELPIMPVRHRSVYRSAVEPLDRGARRRPSRSSTSS